MTLLNLKTFINVTVKKNNLYYYNNREYHIFTDGIIVYSILKDSHSEQANKNFEELYNNRTIEFPLSKSLDDVVKAYKEENRKHVTDCDSFFIPDRKALKVFYSEKETEDFIVIDEKYKKCCKANPKKGKEIFTVDTKIKEQNILVYFEDSPKTGEFIMVMPIKLGK